MAKASRDAVGGGGSGGGAVDGVRAGGGSMACGAGCGAGAGEAATAGGDPNVEVGCALAADGISMGGEAGGGAAVGSSAQAGTVTNSETTSARAGVRRHRRWRIDLCSLKGMGMVFGGQTSAGGARARGWALRSRREGERGSARSSLVDCSIASEKSRTGETSDCWPCAAPKARCGAAAGAAALSTSRAPARCARGVASG